VLTVAMVWPVRIGQVCADKRRAQVAFGVAALVEHEEQPGMGGIPRS